EDELHRVVGRDAVVAHAQGAQHRAHFLRILQGGGRLRPRTDLLDGGERHFHRRIAARGGGGERLAVGGGVGRRDVVPARGVDVQGGAQRGIESVGHALLVVDPAAAVRR